MNDVFPINHTSRLLKTFLRRPFQFEKPKVRFFLFSTSRPLAAAEKRRYVPVPDCSLLKNEFFRKLLGHSMLANYSKPLGVLAFLAAATK